MFSFHFTRFRLPLALLLSLFAGCNLWHKTNDANSSVAPPVAEDLKSEIPFSTKEPERFQAEIVVTAGALERRTFMARSGAQRRYDFNFGQPNQLTALATDKNYLILPARRIYAENIAAGNGAADEWAEFLTSEWLSARTEAGFEKLETAGNVTKYRVSLERSDSSEIFVFVDETLQIPVRQEFYAVGGGQKTLTYAFELKNLKLETDAGLFSVPADFKKVSAEQLQKLLQSAD
jgi:hypothetical protein